MDKSYLGKAFSILYLRKSLVSSFSSFTIHKKYI